MLQVGGVTDLNSRSVSSAQEMRREGSLASRFTHVRCEMLVTKKPGDTTILWEEGHAVELSHSRRGWK